MVFEGRGPYIDLLICGDWERGTFQVLGNYQKQLGELTADERKASTIDRLTEGQRVTLEWVGTAQGIWKDTHGVSAAQVANAMTQPRKAINSERETTRKQLDALVKAGLLSKSRHGQTNRYSYRSESG